MKKIKKVCLLFLPLIFVVSLGLHFSEKVYADSAIGDDYPSIWKNKPLGATYDTWGMATRYCTSFVASRLNTVNGYNIQRNGMDWNADKWGMNARRQGIKVDNNPVRGSVAYWSSMHVAWVAAVQGNQVLLEEYNNPAGSGNYNTRWINKNQADGYIHFKDLDSKPVRRPDHNGQGEHEQYIYRLMNNNSGKHHFTTSEGEANSLVDLGWSYEGVSWVAPSSGSSVYRLYNPNDGGHFYTIDSNERDVLVAAGWKYEGVAFCSGGTMPVYRVYNPNTSEHFYTLNSNERDVLVAAGWRAEGVAFYALRAQN